MIDKSPYPDRDSLMGERMPFSEYLSVFSSGKETWIKSQVEKFLYSTGMFVLTLMFWISCGIMF